MCQKENSFASNPDVNLRRSITDAITATASRMVSAGADGSVSRIGSNIADCRHDPCEAGCVARRSQQGAPSLAVLLAIATRAAQPCWVLNVEYRTSAYRWLDRNADHCAHEEVCWAGDSDSCPTSGTRDGCFRYPQRQVNRPYDLLPPGWKAVGVWLGYAMSSKDSDVVSVIPSALSIVAMAYGTYGLASHQHLHIMYLMLAALGIIACTLFEDRLPPES